MDPTTWKLAMGRIVDRAQKYIGIEQFPADTPSRLFHFTDAAGVLGILRYKSLWLSLAHSMNDRSEISWAINEARSLILDGIPGIDEEFGLLVCKYFDPKHSPDKWRVEYRPYLASFCARTDRSVHWLHYGRSGTGFAVGFSSSAFRRAPLHWVKVQYSLPELQNHVRSMISSVHEELSRVTVGADEQDVASLRHVAAHATAGFITAAAPRYKDPAFANEDEWRLMVLDVEHPLENRPDEHPIETNFRSVSGRIVPYKSIEFDPAAGKSWYSGIAFRWKSMMWH
jgi:hypothetical protein